MTIYHLAPAARWRDWPGGTPYLPAEYGADGFVHCTAGDGLMLEVANTFYRDAPGDFVLLVIEPDRLTAPLKWERSTDGLAQLFPHIYGPIDGAAVVEVRPVRRGIDGAFLGW
ncbi:MAG: DUF952 domain-containing protein [Roseiflexaceae bacterium]